MDATATELADRIGAEHPVDHQPVLELGLVEERLGALEKGLESLSKRLDTLGVAATGTIPSAPTPEALNELPRMASQMGSGSFSRAEARDPRGAEEMLPSHETMRPPKVPGKLNAQTGSKHGEQRRPKAALQPGGPVLRGTLNGVSLGTLFSLLEYERCGGLLALSQGSHTMELTFLQGAIVRCELDGELTSALMGIQTVCDWSAATFSFRNDASDDEKEGPHSGNALMLEALRHQDESTRAS